MSDAMHAKVVVTLKSLELTSSLAVWFHYVNYISINVPTFRKLCWLKNIAGAWFMGVTLYSVEGRGCVFGWGDARDELCHYLRCPML